MALTEALIDVLDLAYLPKAEAETILLGILKGLDEDGLQTASPFPGRGENRFQRDFVDALASACGHSTKRADKPVKHFGLKDVTGNSRLRDLCCKTNNGPLKEFVVALAELRFYLLDKAYQAAQFGIEREKNVEKVSELLLNTLKDKPAKFLLETFTLFVLQPTEWSFKYRIAKWISEYEVIKNSHAHGLNKAEELFVALENLQLERFQSYGQHYKISQQPRFAASKPQVYTNLIVVETEEGESIVSAPRGGEEPDHLKLRINRAQANRLSLGYLTVDEHHTHFWPPSVREIFEKTLEGLKQSDELDKQVKALCLRVSSLIAINPSEVLFLPITTNQFFSSQDWHLYVVDDGIRLRKARPNRVDSVRLPPELIPYTHVLSENLTIHLEGYDRVTEAISTTSKEKICTTILAITSLEIQYEKAEGKKPVFTVWLETEIRKLLPQETFFKHQAIRFQAFDQLLKYFGDPVIAELALATPEQSTSPTTAYSCKIVNNENVAGSQLSFTNEGIKQLTEIIDDRFHEALKEKLDTSSGWIELLNLASERIWFMDLACTGRRPTATGIENFKEIRHDLRFAFLEDKFVAGLEEGRIVPICDLFKEELVYFHQVISKLSNANTIPRELQNHYKNLLTESTIQKSTMTSIIHLEKGRNILSLSECRPIEVIRRYALELENARNAFRHYWAQSISAQTKVSELTRVFLGHSSSISMLYGEESTRIRQDDVEQLLTLMNRTAKGFSFDSFNFWNPLIAGLTSHLKKCDETDKHIKFPPLTGRKGRELIRTENKKTEIKKLKENLIRFDESCTKLNTAKQEDSQSQCEEQQEVTKEKNKERAKYLQTLSGITKKLGVDSINTVLTECGWPHSVSTCRRTQLFPTANIFAYDKIRSDLKNLISSKPIQEDKQARVVGGLVRLIYDFKLLSKRQLKNLFKPKWTRITRDTRSGQTVYLEIALRRPFGKEPLVQCYRIAISEDLLFTQQNLSLIKQKPTKAAKKIFETFGDSKFNAIENFLLEVQKQARDLAAFEECAFLANHFAKDTPTTSSSWSTVTSDYAHFKEGNRNSQTGGSFIKHAYKEEKLDQWQQNLKSFKGQFYQVLQNKDWKLVKSDLTNLRKEIASNARFSSQKFMIDWARNLIDRDNGRSLEVSTLHTYSSTVFEFLNLFRTTPLELVDDEEIESCLAQHLKKTDSLQDPTVFYAATNSFLDFLVKQGFEKFSDHLMEYGCEVPKAVCADWITERTFQKLISKIYNTATPDRDQTVCLLSCLYRFGLRREEALYLLNKDLIVLGRNLLGLTVRGNKYRNLKGRKPAKKLFIHQEDQLTELEKKCWSSVISAEILTSGSLKNPAPVFSDSIRSSQQLTILNNQIQEICGNGFLTFHSLRHSFANRRFLGVVPCSSTFLKRAQICASRNSASNALKFVKDDLRHSSISTTLQSYIHTVDLHVQQLTCGKRRVNNNAIDLSPYTIDDFAFPTCEKEAPKNRRSQVKFDDHVLVKHDALSFVLDLEKNYTVPLSESACTRLEALLPQLNGFHPSAPKILLDTPGRLLKVVIGKYKPKLLQRNNLREALLKDLGELLSKPYFLNIELSPLSDIITATGEIVLSSQEDFNWIAALGIDPQMITAECTKEGDQKCLCATTSGCIELSCNNLKCSDQIPVVNTAMNISNHYGNEGLVKGKNRIRITYRSAKSTIDTFIFLVLLLAIRLNAMQQENQ